VRNNTVSNSRLGISVNGARNVLLTNNEVMHNYQFGFGVDAHDNHFIQLINNYSHENGGREWASLTTFSLGLWTSHPVINGPAFKALSAGKTGSSDKLPGFWRAKRVYSANEYVYQSDAAKFNGCEYRATVSGTSGSTEPLWPASVGQKVVDGSVTWLCEKPRTTIIDGSITWQLAGTGQSADYYGGFYIGVENGYSSDNVTISGNTSNNNLGYGIKVDGYSRDDLFMPNIFVANNTTNNNSQNGIHIDYVKTLKVSGNQEAYNAKTPQIYIGTNQLPYHN
jgi:parallel beta-helix repeat protein